MSKQVLVIAVAAMAGAIGLRMWSVDAAAAQRRTTVYKNADFVSSPGRAPMQIATFGHAHGWADVLWLQLIQEIGSETKDDSSWDRVMRLARIATDLDPQYLHVYHSSAVHLSTYGKRPDQSDELAIAGWNEMPWAWTLGLVTGYNSYFLRGDAQRAAPQFLRACQAPASKDFRYRPPPRYLCALAGRVQSQGGDRQGAIVMLEMMMEAMSRDDPMRRDVEYRIVALRSETRLTEYDMACERYHQQNGRFPENGEELHRAGLVDSIPQDLFGAPIEFKAGDGCVATTHEITVRESVAKARTQEYRDSEVGTATTAAIKNEQIP